MDVELVFELVFSWYHTQRALRTEVAPCPVLGLPLAKTQGSASGINTRFSVVYEWYSSWAVETFSYWSTLA